MHHIYLFRLLTLQAQQFPRQIPAGQQTFTTLSNLKNTLYFRGPFSFATGASVVRENISKSHSKSSKKRGHDPTVVTLKAVAEYVQLSPGTISAVLNDSPSSRHIPEGTRKRIVDAARHLNYKPNFFARYLRNKRTYTIGIMLNDIGSEYGGLVISGIEDYVRQKDYFFITGVHRHDPDLFARYERMLLERGVEGVITLDLHLPHAVRVPTVAIAGHHQHEGVTNIVLDHKCAARLALQHLAGLGHREIAVLKGNPASADSHERWQAIAEAAQSLGISIHEDLVVQLVSESTTPELGYAPAKTLLQRKRPFTALFAFNDISAIGAIRAFQEAGLRVPQDVSVIGFDDIKSAAYQYPSLTTIRQPLWDIGQTAAKTLLARIEGEEKYPLQVSVKPELIARESTAKAAR
jgi:DNA-binding LacI/PurR family transcriptional regulator